MIKNLLVFCLLVTSHFGLAQNDVKVDLSNPNATIYTHLYFLQKDSYFPKKSAATIYGYKEDEAIEKAIRLKEVMDGRGLIVDFNKVPTDPNYIDSTGGYANKHRYVLFPLRMPEISVSKYGDKWYYSKETIAKVDELYQKTYAWNLDWLQTVFTGKWASRELFNIKMWQYLGLFLILLINTILFFIINKLVFFILKKTKDKFVHASSHHTRMALKKLARPITLLVLIKIAEKFLPSLHLELDVNSFVFLVLNVAKTVFWVYVFLKVIQVVMSIYAIYVKQTHAKLDDQLVPILNIFLTGLVIFLGVLRVLPLLGIDVKAVIMGASIGGLALALASQDTVKNLLGTVMIFLDKPFHIDDWIEAGGVVGTVEEVGFRSTRVRAADTSVFQIPNSQLSEIVINNKGMRKFRRYQTTLGIRYDTPPELVDAFVSGIEELIKAHPHINSDNFKVAFSGFGDSALEIMVNVYFTVLDWGVVQTSKHHFHLAIMRLAKALNIDFAFPSSTLYMEQFPGKPSLAIDYNTDEQYIKESTSKVVESFSKLIADQELKRASGSDDDDE